MKIFNWMRNKLNEKESINKPDPDTISRLYTDQSQPCKEEFCDWPNTLLAIGTLGNTNLKETENLPPKKDPLQNTTTSEEFAEVDKVLTQLLYKHISSDPTLSGESEKHNVLLLDKLLDSLPKTGDSTGSKDVHLPGTTSLIQREVSDIRLDNKKKGSAISKKSLTFLLKKVFLCSSGFAPNPMLRDPLPLPDQKLDKSRMEKILRAMLHKRIYPHRQHANATCKKYLDMPERNGDDGYESDKECDRSKWVKTDSEYIVLEI